MKIVEIVKDSTSFTLNEADLTGKKVGESLKTETRYIPRLDGREEKELFQGKWCVKWFPAGYSEASKNHFSVALRVDTSYIKVKYTIDVKGTSINVSTTSTFNETDNCRGQPHFATHEQLRPLFIDGKLTVICNVEFFIEAPFNYSQPRMFRCCEHVPTDFDLVIGTERLQVHKSMLSLLSPVFYAMLTHDTAESRSGEVKIIDFDFDTVKAAIDYCYGREIDVSVDVYIKILRFVDKYDIKDVIFLSNAVPMTADTFSSIAHYAYDFSKDELLSKCCTFFVNNQDKIKKVKKFTELPPEIVVYLLRTSFDLKTDIEVLRYACEKGIDLILDSLERPLIQSMTLDDLCSALDYAWEFSRDDLKTACANFMNDNFGEVPNREMKAFFVDLTIQLMRIARKHKIQDVIDKFESIPKCNLSIETFIPITHYSYDYPMDELRGKCCEFFKLHYDEIKVNEKFAELPPKIVVLLLRTAFDLETDFDVLHYVYSNDISFIVDHLERHLVESMTLDDFCPAANYAWKYSRDTLKNACASFVKNNFKEVNNLDIENKLPFKLFREILLLGHCG